MRGWERWMEVRELSPATRKNYRYHLLALCADLLLEPAEITEDVLTDHLASIKQKGNSVQQIVRATRSFYRWACRRIPERYPENPTLDLRPRSPKYPPAEFLTLDEINRLLAAAYDHHPRRAWALILALETGARIGSLAGVRPEDAGTRPGQLIRFNVAKGDRPYAVPLTPRAAEAVQALLELRPARPAQRETLLGVSKNTLWQWHHTAARRAGLPPSKQKAHILRKTFATRRLLMGESERVVQELLNHADSSQMRRYTAVTDRLLRSAMAESISDRRLKWDE